MKDKNNAAILALLLGGIGAHKFYLGNIGVGIIYLIFSFTFIPMLAGFIDFIVLALMDKDEFNRRYNGSNMLPPSVVVNMLPPAGYGGYGQPYGQPYGPVYGQPPSPYGQPGYPGAPPGAAMLPPAPSGRNVDQLKGELEKLNELRISGLLTEEEFAQQKARLLGTVS